MKKARKLNLQRETLKVLDLQRRSVDGAGTLRCHSFLEQCDPIGNTDPCTLTWHCDPP